MWMSHYLLMTLQPSVVPQPVVGALMPVTLTEAKAWLREDLNENDALITGLIGAAASMIEQITGVVIGGQRVESFSFPAFGQRLVVPRRPLIDAISISYDAVDGVETPVAPGGWRVREFAGQPALMPSPGTIWPQTLAASGAVRIQVRVGYATRAEVPETLRQAAFLLIAHWFANREAEGGARGMPLGISMLLEPYRRGLAG